MTQRQIYQPIERNLAMELARVTEAAALSAARYMGFGDKELVDQSAVDAMRHTLDGISMDGVVVIGEGEKDEAPMLYVGEHSNRGRLGPARGHRRGPGIDGTTLLAKGLAGAIAVMAMSARGAMNVPGEVFYMDKIAVGPEAKDAVDIEAPVADNLRAWVARCAQPEGGRSHRHRPRPPAARADDRGHPSGGRSGEADHGRRRSGRDSGCPSPDRRGRPHGRWRHDGGRADRRRDPVRRRRAAHASLGPATRRSARRRSTRGLDLGHVYNAEELVGGQDVFFAATGASTGELLQGVRSHRSSGAARKRRRS